MKAAALALSVAVFLAFVGAFGSEAMPLIPRYLMFAGVGVVIMGAVVGVVTLTARSPALKTREVLRAVVNTAILTPVTALIAWVIVGFAVMGGPKLGVLPDYLIVALGMTVAMSVLSRLVFHRGRLSRPPVPDSAAADGARPVAFLDRLPPSLRGAELWAVQAEDHYVRLHTSKGTALILLRLADAATELEGLDGARVHRSWWVARAAVAGAARRGAQTVLLLPGGVEAPVSRAQAGPLKRAGWW